MKSEPIAVSDEFVVRICDSANEDGVRSLLAGRATLTPLPGKPGLFVVRLVYADRDPRQAWQELRAATGMEVVGPTLASAGGSVQYPTGAVHVRFQEVQTDEAVASFAAQQGLRVVARNRYQPLQVQFEAQALRDVYLPDLIESLAADPRVRAAWPDTLARFVRA